MKFMLMMNAPRGTGDWAVMNWAPADLKAHIDFMKRFAQQLHAAGELVGAEGLASPAQARVVRAGKAGAGPEVTDGPFPEAKEFLAGFWTVDVESSERAYAIAAQASAAPGPGGKPMYLPIEVREVMCAPLVDGVSQTRPHSFERLLRELSPQVLAAVARRFRDFTAAEDAVQEALLVAALHWPSQGLPDNPRAWLIQVAARRMTDQLRAELSRRRRETALTLAVPADIELAPAPDSELAVDQDDTLLLLFMCCHPALTRPSAIALTLRAVGGLTTAEIASAFLVPEATMAQRISRAKQTIQSSELPFAMPSPEEREARLETVLAVLYLIFNEGYAASAGALLARSDLSSEAIRLTRALAERLPDDPELGGLLALMLLTDARRPARADAEGALIPLDEQDRSLWQRDMIDEGVALITRALAQGQVGSYQIQAAIAAVHDEAARAEDTDWPQILALYELLRQQSDNPMVTLSYAVATAMVHGPRAGLELLGQLDGDPRIAGHHRLDAVRAHLLERAHDHAAASTHYRMAAARTNSIPERNYLIERAARLAGKLG